MSLLLLFIDGLGIGSTSNNPLASKRLGPLNFHRENLESYSCCGGRIKAIDANLGVDGLPQSATGQTSIFGGVNAPKALGKHLSGMPNRKLRDLLRRDSIFLRLIQKGLKATFANAFSPAYFLYPLKRISASTLHMLYAGIKPRWLWQIEKGAALYQDFNNDSLENLGFHLPHISPEQAGKILAGFLQNYNFTLYEYFQTDTSGHGRTRRSPDNIIAELDGMIASILGNIDLEQHTVAICSDHGNIEDLSVHTHTRNPVPFISWGKNADSLLDGVSAISDICNSVENYFV